MQLQSHDTLDYSVYMRMKEMIVDRQLKSGELLVQNQLSKDLGVSRTPLRKALAQLEMEGLLEGSPKGWYVKEFTREDLISVFRIRGLLEGLACRLAAEKLEIPDLVYLEAMFEQAYSNVSSMQAEAYYKADVLFHEKVIQASGDRLLIRTIQSNQIILTSQIQGLYRSPQETFPEHMSIIAALRNKEGLAAERIMREHIEKAIPLLESGTYEIYK